MDSINSIIAALVILGIVIITVLEVFTISHRLAKILEAIKEADRRRREEYNALAEASAS